MKLMSRQLGRLIAMVLLAVPSFAALAAAVGTVTAVVGNVEVVRYATKATEALATRDPIYLSDTVKTAEQSHSKLLLLDQSILKIGPLSELVISEQLIGMESGDRTVINLLKGRLRSLVGRKLQRVSTRFEVHTPVAVALVRGTDFEVWARSATETIVRTYEGRVEVYNIDPDIPGSIIVEPNTYTVIGRDRSPAPPRIISPQEKLHNLFKSKEGGTDEEKLRQAEEAQIKEPDLGESSPADEYVRTDVEVETRLDQIQDSIDTLSVDALVEEDLRGGSNSSQLQTIDQPGDRSGISVPIQIEIPTP